MIMSIINTLKLRNNLSKYKYSEELLELCKSLRLLILNGRKVGDLFGKYTSIQWNGCSVVDYVLASNSIYSSISYLAILYPGCLIIVPYSLVLIPV